MAPVPNNVWDVNSIYTFLAEAKAQRQLPCESDTLGPWLSSGGDTPDTPALGHTHTQYPPTPSQHSVVSSSTECTRNSSIFSTTNAGAANSAHRHHYHHRGGGGSGSGVSTINSDDVPDTRELSGPEGHAMHDMAALQSTTTTLRSCRMPCEFAWYTGCTATFDASTERESWIRHEVEAHLDGILPAACLCWFCDDFKFIADQMYGGDRGVNFHSRMQHIASHFQDGASARGRRSDFFFLDHLWGSKLILREVFEKEKARHEEMQVQGLMLRPRGYRTERMVRDEERRVSVVVDTRKEEREWRRAAGGQGRRRD